jgi:hypothetical protein
VKPAYDGTARDRTYAIVGKVWLRRVSLDTMNYKSFPLKHISIMPRYRFREVSLYNKSRSQITVEPGYNDIGLYDTSPIVSDILWYKLILHP